MPREMLHRDEKAYFLARRMKARKFVELERERRRRIEEIRRFKEKWEEKRRKVNDALLIYILSRKIEMAEEELSRYSSWREAVATA